MAKTTEAQHATPEAHYIAVFEVETTDGETFLVHCERAMLPSELRAAEANLAKQPGARKVHQIGTYKRVLEYTANEMATEILFPR